MADPEFTPLLLSPYDEFVGDASLARVATKVINNLPPQQRCVLSARDATNMHLLVSSVDSNVIDRVASTLVPWAKGAWIIVLAFPHHAYAIDIGGKAIVSPVNSKFAAIDPNTRISYIPYKWPQACNFAISMRMANFCLAYKKCRTYGDIVADLEKECATLKASLQSELEINEMLASRAQKREKKLLDAQRATQKSVNAHGRLAALECQRTATVETTFAHELRAMEHDNAGLCAENGRLRKEMSSLESRIELLGLNAHKRNKFTTETVLQVALQCHHYFTYDRFSSSHMRKHIVAENGREELPIGVLSSFPRLIAICDGDVDVIKAACRLLHVRVEGGSVIISSIRM